MNNQGQNIKNHSHKNLHAGVTLVITSCGRETLLHKTCMSFGRFNTYPLNEVILVEDGGINHNSELIAKYLNVKLEKIKIIKNRENIGQIKSIDIAYAEVSSEYIFHCEDDWEFYGEGFIEQSIDILEGDANILCVWLRAHNDLNGHPIEPIDFKAPRGSKYFLIGLNFLKVWNGFTFNPGLRRISDYLAFGPYANAAIVHKFQGKYKISESDLSIHYQKLGFRAAVLFNSKGYVRHIGGAHHLAADWEFKYLVDVKNFIRKIIYFGR
ncbi:glycosyltransferase family 2 protein [Polynucleobacter paneuropaeus]|nr:glycosyltransferase family 2 protein [Polynucleobacter paneuropaeus]